MKPSSKKHFNDSTNSQMDIFILTIAQKSLCSVKGVAGSEEPTRNYHLNLQFTTSLLHSFFSVIQLIVLVDGLVHFFCLHNVILSQTKQTVSAK